MTSWLRGRRAGGAGDDADADEEVVVAAVEEEGQEREGSGSIGGGVNARAERATCALPG